MFGHRVEFQIAPGVDIGILYIMAIGSLAVYGVILAGWASNSKYSFLGGLRSSAQLISYEIPMGLSILGMILITGTLDLTRIIEWQDRHVWGVSGPAVLGSFCSWSVPSRRPTGYLSTSPSRSRNSSAGFTPNIRR